MVVGLIMNCIICGKKMDYTGCGNYHCQECGHGMNDLVHRPSNCDIPMPHDFGKQEGWICPVCGRGVAPWVDYCPCRGSELNITYGTTTYTNKDVEQYEQYSINNCGN